jgi:ABC-type nitrate/sulfonate/bicarbonate transport system substrate-binding protein
MHKLILGFLGAILLSTSVGAADRIRIGIPNIGAQFMTFPLAQKKGFFAEENLEVEHIRIFGQVAMAALVNGELDYWGAIGFTIRSAIQGIPVRATAGFLPVHPSALVARPEIKSVQALRGHTLGTSTFGGAPEVIARLILRHFGLDPDKDVKFIALGAAAENRLAAMKQGLIAGTVLSVPADSEGVKMGFHVIAKAYELFSYPDAGLTATVSKIKQKPDEVRRMIRAGIRGNRYIRAEREGTIQFLMDWQKATRESAVNTYNALGQLFSEDGALPDKGLRFVIEENKKIVKTTREIGLGDVADLSILKQAQNELRTRQP